jgi:foldase protein PrsA
MSAVRKILVETRHCWDEPRRLFTFVLAVVVIGAAYAARGQQDNTPNRFQVSPRTPRINSLAANPNAQTKDIDVPGLKATPILVKPGDPVAIVNNRCISRQRLADECMARKGKEILDLLISRTLIEQSLRARKLEVTAAEIDQEIEKVAQGFQITREGWLRTLAKERGISPVQYARDIIYPALALRKLSRGRVQVTSEDLKDGFETQYGEKLRCRMILVDKQTTAVAIWEQLRHDRGGFEKIAQEQSIDAASRSLGGLLADPITRHAYPQSLSDAAFRQLVDGDPTDKDPSHKPKDGDFTRPIQVSEIDWVILRRESFVPADKSADLNDPRVRNQIFEMIYEVKLDEAMHAVFQEMIDTAAIEKQLTGTAKLPNNLRKTMKREHCGSGEGLSRSKAKKRSALKSPERTPARPL